MDNESDFIARNKDQVWGFTDADGVFVEVPKLPLVRAGHPAPPFDVTLPGGEVRRIEARNVLAAWTATESLPQPAKAIIQVSRKIKIYTATKLRHATFIRDEISKWPEVEVTSRWPFSHVDGNDPLWPSDCASHGSIFWTRDEEDVRKADAVLLFGDEDDVLRGGLVEAGIGIGLGKRVIVVGTNDSYGTWQFHPLVYRVKDMATARSFLSLLANHLSEKSVP